MEESTIEAQNVVQRINSLYKTLSFRKDFGEEEKNFKKIQTKKRISVIRMSEMMNKEFQ
jgi:hypothetical protein